MEGLAYWFGRFGLGRPTGIGIAETIGHVPGEAGELRHGRIQRAFVTWASGIGQVNVMATPIQMANVAATFARNGIWMRPRLIANAPKLSAYKPRNIGAGDAKDWEDIPDRVDLKLSPEGLAAARKGMINVVNALGGTGTTLESNLQKAEILAEGSVFHGDPGYYRQAYREAQSVTPTEVKRVANRYLTRGRVVLSVVPLGKKQDASKAAQSVTVTDEGADR